MSCASNQEKPITAEEELELSRVLAFHGSYLVKEIQARNISSERVVLKFDSTRTDVSGHAGCNRFSSSFEHKVDSIKFSDPVSTKMYCQGKMELEQQIIEVLPKISQVAKVKEHIVFFSENNERLLSIQKQE